MTREWVSQPMPDPAARLNLNDSMPATKWARAKRRDEAQAWREGAHWMILATPPKRRPKPTGRVTVTVLFGTARPNQRRDPSNWGPTAKHIVDGSTWIVRGNPDGTYTALRCELTEGPTFRRSWQAVRFASGEALCGDDTGVIEHE